MALKYAKPNKCHNGIVCLSINPPVFAHHHLESAFSVFVSSSGSVCFPNGVEFRARFGFQRKKKNCVEAMAPQVRFPGVDEELQKLLDAKMDQAPARRRAREAFKDIQLGIDHILFKVLGFDGIGLFILLYWKIKIQTFLGFCDFDPWLLGCII